MRNMWWCVFLKVCRNLIAILNAICPSVSEYGAALTLGVLVLVLWAKFCSGLTSSSFTRTDRRMERTWRYQMVSSSSLL